jgi:hypothetical protein
MEDALILPSFSEDSNDITSSIPSPEPLETSFTIPPTLSSPQDLPSPSSPFSLKQVQEILHLVTNTLETNVRITPKLLHSLQVTPSITRASTSSTPDDHPMLLSSDKCLILLRVLCNIQSNNYHVILVFIHSRIGRFFMMYVNRIFLLFNHLIPHLN